MSARKLFIQRQIMTFAGPVSKSRSLYAAISLELFTTLAPSASYQHFINELHFILEPTR